MKGEGCRDFENRNKDKTWVTLILFMVQLNARFKRIDIAVDDYEGIHFTMSELIQKISQGFYTSIFISSPLILGSKRSGYTIQFGSNFSNIELVIYDKLLERKKHQQAPSTTYWVRYEMRFRNDNAKRIAYLLSTLYQTHEENLYGLRLQKLADEQLYRILDIKQDNNYSEENQKKAPTDPHWLAFLNNVEKGILRKVEDDDIKQDTLEAYTKTAIPYATFLFFLKYLSLNQDEYLLLLEILKLIYNNLDFSKERFYKMNLFLKELNLPTLDTQSLQTVKKRLEQKIKEHELPF
ncbi:MAG: replication initiation factor domain-containing protein [Anaeroplasmataceae bacterium]|nr:replication initiation factor domain-containing protein [Anaeroplasmataceae bacterium]